MKATRPEQRFDELAAQLTEWVESAVALDVERFPRELMIELDDYIEEFRALLEDPSGPIKRQDILEVFVSPEMAEIAERYPRVRRSLEGAWGSQLTARLNEETESFEPLDDDDEDE